MADLSRHKVEIELTESEADCLLNWVSSAGEAFGSDLQQEQARVIVILYMRLMEAFPNLIASESVMQFLEQNGQRSNDVADGQAVAPVERVLRRVDQDVWAIRDHINAELAKLDKREELIQARYIREVLDDEERYPTMRLCFAEITRRLNADLECRAIRERRQRLRFELAKVLQEVATRSKAP